MLNLNIKAAIESLTSSANGPTAPKSPNTPPPSTKGIDPNANPGANLGDQTGRMLSQQKSQTDTLKAKPDTTPLEYSQDGVKLDASAKPEAEGIKEQPKKGFKENLMQLVMDSFKGGDDVDKANSQNGTQPDTSIQGDPTSNKRPQPPSPHQPPQKDPPNPKINPNGPSNPHIPQPKVPQTPLPKGFSIPKFKGPKF